MSANDDDIDVSGLWGAVRRNALRLALLTLAAGAVTYAVLAQMAPSYRSTAQIILEPAPSAYLRPKGDAGPTSEAPKIEDGEVASQVEVIHSSDLLAKVAADLQLERVPEFNGVLQDRGLIGSILTRLIGDPASLEQGERVLNAIEQRLRVSQVGKTRLITIDMSSADPHLAAKIANAVAAAYLERNRSSQVKDASDATTWIGGNIEEVKKAAEAADAELEKFRASSGLLSGQNNVTLVTQQLSELNTQLTQAKTLRSDAEARARLMREMLASGQIETSQDVVKSNNMQLLFQQRLKVQRDIAELSATLLPAHPRMRQLSSELATIEGHLKDEVRKVARGIEDEVKVAIARQATLEENISQLTAQQLKSSDAQARLSTLEREAQSKRSTYEGLLDRLNEAKTRKTAQAVSALASLNESARPSSVADFPKKVPMTLLAMTAALLAGLVVVLTRELMAGASRVGGSGPISRRGRRATDEATASPVTPVAPDMPLAASSPTPIASPAQTLRMASSETLAQHLLRLSPQASSGVSGQRVLVSGELPGTPVWGEAQAVARSLVTAARSVVLVDWREDLVGAGTKVQGLADVVAGRCRFEEAIRAGDGGPHIIGSGTSAARVDLKEKSAEVRMAIEALIAIYDHVIIAADRARAKAMLEALGGELEVGVTVADKGRDPRAPVEEGFLGYDVHGLVSLWLDAAAGAPKAKAGRRSTFTRLAAVHA